MTAHRKKVIASVCNNGGDASGGDEEGIGEPHDGAETREEEWQSAARVGALKNENNGAQFIYRFVDQLPNLPSPQL